MAKKTSQTVRFFIAVAQSDFTAQMDVVRWLHHDSQYTTVAIEHTQDRYTPEEIAEREPEKGCGYFVRKNGDGSESQLKAGDLKPPHWHILVRTQKKMRAETLTNRFSGQLHFFTAREKFGDEYEAARYLLHKSFGSRGKYQYPESALEFWSQGLDAQEMYRDLTNTENACVVKTVERFRKAKQDALSTLAAEEIEYSDEIAQKMAVHKLLENGDCETIRSIMAHAFFYSKFI